MTVREALEQYIDPDKVVFASLATDGLTPSVDHVLQVSLVRGAEEPTRVFVAGGDAVSTYEFTGIPADLYKYSAESPARAWAAVSKCTGPTATLAMYNSCGFGQPFMEDLRAKGGGVEEFKYVDVLLLAKAARNRSCMGLEPPRTLEGLHYAIQKRPVSKSYSYRLPDMCEWLLIEAPDRQLLTNDINLFLLRELFLRILPMHIG